MTPISTVFVLLVLGGVVAWLARRNRPLAGPTEIDRDILDKAEREVRDVDAFATPDEAAEEVPDWGPGAPQP
ncbi:MAG TPA: hypothetical protein VGA22_12525 [Gemmatimonadales bacterium]|jgi:hypothetical protein